MSLYNKKGIYPLLWLRRIRHSRGFGVQSPTAYSFIRYVINEHYPYYAYSELAEQFPSTGWCERKLFRLYLRIASCFVKKVSKYTSFTGLRLFVYFAPFPALCAFTLRSKLLVQPV